MPGSQKPECVATSLDRGWGAADGPRVVFGCVWKGLCDQSHRVTCPGPQCARFTPSSRPGLCDQLGGPGGGSHSTALARELQGTPKFLGRAFG